jgi:hypothetical protein
MGRNGGYDRYRAALADENAWARAISGRLNRKDLTDGDGCLQCFERSVFDLDCCKPREQDASAYRARGDICGECSILGAAIDGCSLRVSSNRAVRDRRLSSGNHGLSGFGRLRCEYRMRGGIANTVRNTFNLHKQGGGFSRIWSLTACLSGRPIRSDNLDQTGDKYENNKYRNQASSDATEGAIRHYDSEHQVL